MDLIEPLELTLEHTEEPGLKITRPFWNLLNASRDGDLKAVDEVLTLHPKLLDANLWYIPPIHFAVREGHLELVKYLVEKGADISHRSLHGEETLLEMAEDRNRDAVADYLRGLFRERLNTEGDTLPIHKACEDGDFEQVKAELEQDGSLLERGDSVGRRPLHYAVFKGDAALVNYLLEQGADVNGTGFSADNRLGGFGFTPIALTLWKHQYWTQVNNYELTHTLLKHGAVYNITIAAALGDTVRVEELLKEDKGLANFHDSSGKRPLSAASERGYYEIVDMLLKAGALPNLPDGPMAPRGFALWAAARFGHTDIAKLLLEHGADPNAMVESSGNPTESAKDLEMRSLLYTYGGFQNLASHFHHGSTDTIAALLHFKPKVFDGLVATVAFTHCVSSNHSDLLKLMLNAGVRVPHVVNYCQSYLFHNLNLTRLLLEHDMDPDLPNYQKVRPLHYMAKGGNITGAKLFLEFGATPNAIDDEYRSTPLGWAAKYGRADFVKFWLERFPESKHEQPMDMPEWSTPLAWATKRNFSEVVQLLS